MKLTASVRRLLRAEIIEEIQTQGYNIEQATVINIKTGWYLRLGDDVYEAYRWTKGERRLIEMALADGPY